ncbi:MAG: hypothetical protein JSU73_03120 [candidate division WOR-3 bacterium]|nr:MAG: hypothetical protein JSU73_03120 [candidate division WOR-3 bacterium]
MRSGAGCPLRIEPPPDGETRVGYRALSPGPRDARSLRNRVLSAWDSEQDPGRADRFDRLRRGNLSDVLAANFKRAQESSRVLEELLKVEEPALSQKLKSVRFRLYDLEKKAVLWAGKGLQ